MSDDRPEEKPERTPLSRIALLFLRLGTTAFGGPAAHVAMMEEEVVRRRRWLTPERFLDLLGAVNLIPGPNSTEIAMHVGWERRRLPGLVVAGVAFILPAALLTGLLAWAYVRFGTVPAVGWLLYGVKPVVLAIVAKAILGLLPKAARTGPLAILGALAFAAAAFGAHELAVLGAAAVAALLVRGAGRFAGRPPASGLLVALPLAAAPAAAAAAAKVTLSGLFLLFLKTGAVLFGSGYVLLAFLQGDFVERTGWLTETQLLDAIAVGQATPGPIFTAATFIGYLLAGTPGAIVATVGIFLPAFVFVGLSGPLVPKLRASPVAGAVLDGVNVASLALMAFVAVELGAAAVVDVPTAVLAVAAAVALVRFRVNTTWLVAGGAAAGWGLNAAGLA